VVVDRVKKLVTETREDGTKVRVEREVPKYASAHDLRRSFGSRWAKKCMPPVLQRLMRHASIQTTMQFYVGLDADEITDDLWALEGESGNNPSNIPQKSEVSGDA